MLIGRCQGICGWHPFGTNYILLLDFNEIAQGQIFRDHARAPLVVQ